MIDSFSSSVLESYNINTSIILFYKQINLKAPVTIKSKPYVPESDVYARGIQGFRRALLSEIDIG